MSFKQDEVITMVNMHSSEWLSREAAGEFDKPGVWRHPNGGIEYATGEDYKNQCKTYFGYGFVHDPTTSIADIEEAKLAAETSKSKSSKDSYRNALLKEAQAKYEVRVEEIKNAKLNPKQLEKEMQEANNQLQMAGEEVNKKLSKK